MFCEIHPLNSLGEYVFVVTLSEYRGRLLLSRHRSRDTWETQGGHIEPGETPLDAAPEAASPLEKHYAWVREIAARTGTALSAAEAQSALRAGLADKCARVLADAGVYKLTPEGEAGVLRFLESIGYARA